jgi:FMN phosphatase YigB (HAD superfamily)
VTFDFHNTLATCDAWFYLEIRDLPADVLRHIDPDLLRHHSRDDVIARYRALRQGVIASGHEIDAVEGVSRVAEELGIAVERDAIESSVRDLMREAMAHVAPVPGAVEAVRDIAAFGIPVGIISSAVYHPFLEWSLEQFGLNDELAFVVTSASSGFYKSNPEIYRYAMSITGAEPAQSIHIGDSPKWDVWGAQQAGMRAILFENGVTDPLVNSTLESEPNHTVRAMPDVTPWVLNSLGVSTT